ncbi:hypothetical protein ACEZCY_13950 [Streptacidiphilus sp. N1-12]|uniref:Uncharacterized protein n=2 Tax=Streptacidiphilus alkalitolerans TaxID=3342712 RepID=A0ABV6WE59_9ACTN
MTGRLLNWRDPARHWNWAGPLPCRYCGGLTQLLDSKRSPAHKVCAEQALETQAAEQAAANDWKSTL